MTTVQTRLGNLLIQSGPLADDLPPATLVQARIED